MAFLAPLALHAQNTIILTENVTQTIEPNTTYNFYDSGGQDENKSGVPRLPLPLRNSAPSLPTSL